MTKLRTLIVDDEQLARRGLVIRLERMDDIEICAESPNGRRALEDIATHQPDVVFLDIQMPGMSGFDLLRKIAGADMPIIIFVTAFDQFAIEAFRANALDYLLKPIDDAQLANAVERAKTTVKARDAAGHRQRLLAMLCEMTGETLTLEEALTRGASAANDAPSQRLAIRDGGETVCVDMADIDWVDAAGDYMCVHSAGKTYVLRSTMKRLENVLDPRRFVRIHRSTIVNRERVVAMRPHINGEYFLRLDCAKELKLTRNYKDSLPRFAARVKDPHRSETLQKT
ncbi:MAG: LytR/AlgR family response regulator transcription factor [Gammaproteobacteria bacterium]